MPTAIRVNGEIIWRANNPRHIDLLMEYSRNFKKSIDELDEMIERGEIEFGSAWWNPREKTMEWGEDKIRTSVYKSVDRMIEIGGRPKE